MVHERIDTLWGLVASLEADAVRAWRYEKYPQLTTEEFLATVPRSLETTVVRRPGGQVHVTISLISYKVQDNDLDYFSLQRAGKNRWRLNVPGSTRGIGSE